MTYMVLSKVAYPSKLEAEVIKAGRKTRELVKNVAGLSEISFFQSNERNETIMLWYWESQEDHNNFMQSDEWKAHSITLGQILPYDEIEFSSQSFTPLA